MSDTQSFDILVVGGGMTGSALALGLSQQGWKTALVESASAASIMEDIAPANTVHDFEPRVSAISVASQTLLESLGVWAHVDRHRHCPYQAMTVWDADGTGRIHFEAAELQVRALGTIVENRHLVQALFLGLAQSDAEIFDNTRVTGWWEQGVQRGIRLEDGRKISATLVVAADGGTSRLRQWVGLPTREWDYDQQAIVCTVETSQAHQFTAWQRFSTTGPLAFLPLQSESGSHHFCSIVWSQDTAAARRLMALDDGEFISALEKAIEQQLGDIHAVSKRFAFPLRQRHAKDYVRPGVALVGDAAHTIHPLAGQGANLGYSDVAVLLEELARSRRLGLRPDDQQVLARYQRRRKGDNLAMMVTMEGFKQLFARDELPLRWLRNTGMRWLDRISPLKNRLAAEAMGLNRKG
ncbi:MAG: FAD-dependent monooxygenase [Marinobacter sp.]|uniref:FAD-dependent monooxygenase n=1 Tax=Marinobacter sp. TaxID=50741 RepID=UPI0034A03FD8